MCVFHCGSPPAGTFQCYGGLPPAPAATTCQTCSYVEAAAPRGATTCQHPATLRCYAHMSADHPGAPALCGAGLKECTAFEAGDGAGGQGSPDAGMCTSCAGGSSGLCQASDGTCLDYIAGKCTGTPACASTSFM